MFLRISPEEANEMGYVRDMEDPNFIHYSYILKKYVELVHPYFQCLFSSRKLKTDYYNLAMRDWYKSIGDDRIAQIYERNLEPEILKIIRRKK